MNELYSACIIHKRKDSFESLYLQYFLEFIGIGVFNYSFDNTSEENNFILYGQDFNPVAAAIPNAKNPLKAQNRTRKDKIVNQDLFCREMNHNFDTFILLNYDEQDNDWISEIYNVAPNTKIYRLNTNNYKSNVDMLRDTIFKVFYDKNTCINTSDKDNLNSVINLYENEHMVSLLYSFTTNVLIKNPKFDVASFDEAWIRVFDKLNKIVDDTLKTSEDINFKRHLKFALLKTKFEHNKFRLISKSRFPRFDIDSLFEEVKQEEELYFDSSLKKQKFFAIGFLRPLVYKYDDCYMPIMRPEGEKTAKLYSFPTTFFTELIDKIILFNLKHSYGGKPMITDANIRRYRYKYVEYSNDMKNLFQSVAFSAERENVKTRGCNADGIMADLYVKKAVQARHYIYRELILDFDKNINYVPLENIELLLRICYEVDKTTIDNYKVIDSIGDGGFIDKMYVENSNTPNAKEFAKGALKDILPDTSRYIEFYSDFESHKKRELKK